MMVHRKCYEPQAKRTINLITKYESTSQYQTTMYKM